MQAGVTRDGFDSDCAFEAIEGELRNWHPSFGVPRPT
jgi:hypothetical protein